MKLPDDIVEEINKLLKDLYGETDSKPNFRLVWSEDQLEHRWTNFTDEGWQLVNPEVRQLPKYRQWVQEKHILERLTVVPAVKDNDLVEVLSYEPLWVFENAQGPTVPSIPVCKFIIENVLRAIETQGQRVKYKDPNSNPAESLELQKANIEKIYKELFANETEVGDALAVREGVTVPSKITSTKES